jgi:acyl-CoA thioesterase
MTPFSAFATAPISPAPDGQNDAVVLRTTMTDDWLQGRVAFGGIQGALAARAMREAVGADGPALRALQFTFIGPIQHGEVLAQAQVLRRGRGITHAQCSLAAGGRTAAIAVGLYGASRTTEARQDMPAPEGVRALDALHDAPFLPERMPGFLRHYQMRWATGALPFTGKPPRPSQLWARLRDQPITDTDTDGAATGAQGVAAHPADAAGREANLVALGDLPASPVLSMLTKPAPGASLTWLLECLSDPRDWNPREWLLIETVTRHAAAGYTSQTARIWDAQGQPVAVSHQTTAVFG